MQGKLTVASLIAGIGAIVTLLFSFLTIAESPGFDGMVDTNAWSRQGTNIVITIPPLIALGMIVLIVLGLTGTNLTGKVVTFTFDQLKAAFSVFAALIMVFLLVADLGPGSWQIGFWFMLLGSLAMAVGTVMTLLGAGTQVLGASSGGSAGQPQYPDQPPYPNQPYQPPPPQAPGGTPPPPPGSGAPPPPPSGGTPPPPPPNG